MMSKADGAQSHQSLDRVSVGSSIPAKSAIQKIQLSQSQIRNQPQNSQSNRPNVTICQMSAINNDKNIQAKIETTEQILRQAKNKYYLKREHLNPHQPGSNSSLSQKRSEGQSNHLKQLVGAD